jgi:hypothetical protein
MIDFIKKPGFFLAVALLTCVFSLMLVRKRVQVEDSNTATMMVADVDLVESLSASQSLTADEGVERLKQKGLGGLVVSEQTIDDLLMHGKATLTSVSMQGKVEANSLEFSDTETIQRVIAALNLRFGKLVQTSVTTGNKLPLPPVDLKTIRETSVGLDPTAVELAKKHQLAIVGRFENPVGISAEAVTKTIEGAAAAGASVFLAQGEQVLGRRDALDATVEALRKTKMIYASPEFAKLGGDDEMLTKLPLQSVRLHSAQAAELDKLSLDAAIERYRKAAKERNMRILLLRNVSSASPAPLDAFGDFMGSLRAELLKDKLTMGAPSPFVEPFINKLFKILVGVFGALSAIWVCFQIWSEKNAIVLGGLGAAAIVLGSALNGKGLQISALLLSMVFPLGAFFLFLELKLNAWVSSIVMPLFAMIGGLCVAGLLNGVEYYIHAEAFAGVKISVFLPIFIIGIVGFARLNNLKDALKEPITWGAMGLGVVILGALVLMFMRTGNDNPNAVSGGEMAFRGLLETLMPVRPRSKEFLLGFPALFVGLSMLAAAGYDAKKLGRLSGWAALLLMLGGVGLTDVVNTLCHLHTPVKVSLTRDLLGIVIGVGVGAIVWFPIRHKVTQFMSRSEA